MTDFDDELLQRLHRLDAAVPEPARPVTANPQLHRPRRRGRLVLALAAVIALVVGTSLVALGTAPPPDPAQVARDEALEEQVREDLTAHEGEACRTPEQAFAHYRARLDALGLSDWTIRTGENLRESPCVSAGVSGQTHEVVLTPAMGPQVNDVVEALKVDLLERCLNRDEAIELLRSTLISAGVVNPQIVVGGVRGVPIDGDDRKAYLQHIADGCVVFGDAQSDQNGRYTWSLVSR